MSVNNSHASNMLNFVSFFHVFFFFFPKQCLVFTYFSRGYHSLYKAKVDYDPSKDQTQDDLPTNIPDVRQAFGYLQDVIARGKKEKGKKKGKGKGKGKGKKSRQQIRTGKLITVILMFCFVMLISILYKSYGRISSNLIPSTSPHTPLGNPRAFDRCLCPIGGEFELFMGGVGRFKSFQRIHVI